MRLLAHKRAAPPTAVLAAAHQQQTGRQQQQQPEADGRGPLGGGRGGCRVQGRGEEVPEPVGLRPGLAAGGQED